MKYYYVKDREFHCLILKIKMFNVRIEGEKVKRESYRWVKFIRMNGCKTNKIANEWDCEGVPFY